MNRGCAGITRSTGVFPDLNCVAQQRVGARVIPPIDENAREAELEPRDILVIRTAETTVHRDRLMEQRRRFVQIAGTVEDRRQPTLKVGDDGMLPPVGPADDCHALARRSHRLDAVATIRQELSEIE